MGRATRRGKELLANLTLVRREHPALAGYHACDNCCHTVGFTA